MIYSEDLAKEEVECLYRKDCLPETDEMETERYSFEDFVLFDSSDYLSGNIFGLEDRDDA